MNKEFILYEQALTLKELGFDEPCLSYFSESQQLHLCRFENMSDRGFVSAPTYQQTFRWFREKYEYYYHIFPLQITVSDQTGYRYSWEIYNHTPEWIIEDRSLLGSLTYEEAELDCLIKLIEITKTK
jgi:hypothetical protein